VAVTVVDDDGPQVVDSVGCCLVKGGKSWRWCSNGGLLLTARGLRAVLRELLRTGLDVTRRARSGVAVGVGNGRQVGGVAGHADTGIYVLAVVPVVGLAINAHVYIVRQHALAIVICDQTISN
jgi:hypothetical protein